MAVAVIDRVVKKLAVLFFDDKMLVIVDSPALGIREDPSREI